MSRYSILEMGNLQIIQERERLLVRALRRHGILSLEGLRMFEAGCAGGYNLRLMVQWGGRPEDQGGIDLSEDSIAYCRSRAPEMRLYTGSAESIPEPDESFDLSFAFTLFSSVPDESVSRQIGAEMFRITRPGGLIVVYDMRRKSPGNSAVHPVSTEDVRRWFPKCPARVRHLTLAPPIARLIGRHAPFLYGPLATIPLLRTHTLYVLQRPALPLTRDMAPVPAELTGSSAP